MTNTQWFLFLAGLVGIGFLIRFIGIAQAPPILNRDEAALAYNAYLLTQTGSDEWGRQWPLTFESFGDFKLPGYHWILAGLFWLFEPSEMLVRLPSAVAGSLLVVAVFWFVRALKFASATALMAAILVTFNPVFIFYSRMAFEANVGLMLLVFGLAALFTRTGVNNTRLRISLDAVGVLLLILGILTYNTPLLLLPFIIPALIYARGMENWQKWVPTAALLSVVAVGFVLAFASLTAQKKGITLFSDETTTIAFGEYRQQYFGDWSWLLENRYAYYAQLISGRFIKSFSYDFLVSRGGAHPWHALPGWGHIYAGVYILGWIGLVALAWLASEIFSKPITILKSEKVKQALLVLWLLVIGLAPSVVTVDAPHATRSLFFLVMWMIVAAVGWQFTWRGIENKLARRVVQVLFVAIAILPVVQYVPEFINDYSVVQARALRAGYPAALANARANSTPQETIAVVDPDGYQYILTAWYEKISPDSFYATLHRQDPDRIGFRYVDYLTNIHFISDPADVKDESVLVQWIEDEWRVTRL